MRLRIPDVPGQFITAPLDEGPAIAFALSAMALAFLELSQSRHLAFAAPGIALATPP